MELKIKLIMAKVSPKPK